MTENCSAIASPTPEPAAEILAEGEATPRPEKATPGSMTSNKVFWAGVGIGSAALVAALMYARRPKKKR